MLLLRRFRNWRWRVAANRAGRATRTRAARVDRLAEIAFERFLSLHGDGKRRLIALESYDAAEALVAESERRAEGGAF